jgi:putative FmdB family regulatory protein
VDSGAVRGLAGACYDFAFRGSRLPLYEYKCSKGHVFEKIESVSAPAVRKCPTCGAKAERQLSAPAIQFKGSGWYVTDYAGKSSAASKDRDGDSTKAEAKPGAKSDAKPDSKSEGKSDSKSGSKSSSESKSSSSEKSSSKKKN